MIPRRVVVTGMGAVTPLGVGVRTMWHRLVNGETGIRSTADIPGVSDTEAAQFATIPSRVVGIVPVGKKDGEWDVEKYITPSEAKRLGKFAQYAIAASIEALGNAEIDPTELSEAERSRFGVCIGSSIGSFEDVYRNSVAFNEGNYRKVQPLFIPRFLGNMAAGNVSIRFGLYGPNHSAATACTTGAHSIGDAFRFIQYGDADVMLCGSAESAVHPLALAGFARAKSLCTAFNSEPSRASRPFDRDRNGFVMGEGSGVLVLESLDRALERKAEILAEVSGYGVSADGYHITAPHPSGRGAVAAMNSALRQAGVRGDAVDYVNAHATGTQIGDAVESLAVKQALLVGERSKPGEINVSSSKGALGHLLGAAGSVESIIAIKALQEVSRDLEMGRNRAE